VLTKPKLIFVKNIDEVYPFIIFAVEYSHRLENYFFGSRENFSEIFDKLIERKEEFDFLIYTPDGLKPLHFENIESSLFFQWNVKSTADNSLEVTLLCKNNDSGLSSYMPLSHNRIIDFDNNSIVTLGATNPFYKQLHDIFIGLVSKKIIVNGVSFLNRPRIGMILRTVKPDSIIKALKKYKYGYCSPFLGANVLLAEFNDCMFFQDCESSVFDRHARIVDLEGNPSRQLVSLEKQINFKYAFSGRLMFSCSLDGLDYYRDFYAIKSRNRFIKLMETILKEKKTLIIVPIIAEFIKTVGDNSLLNIDKTVRKDLSKQLNFLSAANKNRIITELFSFCFDQHQQKLIHCYYTSKLEPEHTITSEKELSMTMLTLIEYCCENNLKVELQNSMVIVEADQSILVDLFAYAHKTGVALYFKNKKTVAHTFDIEIDVNGDEDWFSITPDFYEKDVLLSKDEWQKFLGIDGDYFESDTEVHLFDAKTTNMLQLLRSMSTEYKKKSGEKIAAYLEIPRLHIFTLLSLNKSGMKLKMSEDDKKILQGLHNFITIPLVPIPEKLQCTLRDYQAKGYDWLSFLYRHKFGACLADEMGLGKTVQTITFLAGLHEERVQSWKINKQQPHLIVAPATVIGNWEQEIKKFYPTFSIDLYVGAKRILNLDVDIVLTTYDTIRVDAEKLVNTPFHVIVFDEAQAIKNHKSQKASASFQLKSLFKICLTGTPLENNAKELCSIINLALPGLLPEDSVVARLVKKGEYQALIEKIAPFMLRRTKAEYLHDLPAKIEDNEYLEMSKKQKGFYGAIIDEIKKKVYKAYREKTEAQAGIIALTALLRLRQICISPSLLDQDNLLKTKQHNSPKIDYLLQEINKCQNQKIPLLIFSQFTKALDILTQQLSHNNIKYFRIDGSVSVLQRKKIVEEFQTTNTVFVFVLSLKTGGVGLNLTRARIAYHLDPWWNPAVENQASDRIHRIGQEHEVKIIRLIMKDSIEEKMLVLKEKKRILFDAIMNGASGSRSSAITRQDFDFLLS